MPRVVARAGVSVGGVFRHFPTREALMVAVGEDVAQRMLASYRGWFGDAREDGGDAITRALKLLRRATRARLNQAWLELVHACRTDAALKKALAPVGRRYADAIDAVAAAVLPELSEALGDRFPLLVRTVVALFDGEQMQRMLFAEPALEEERVELLVALVGALGVVTEPRRT
jgi:AcrR family transcriptional regulator